MIAPAIAAPVAACATAAIFGTMYFSSRHGAPSASRSSVCASARRAVEEQPEEETATDSISMDVGAEGGEVDVDVTWDSGLFPDVGGEFNAQFKSVGPIRKTGPNPEALKFLQPTRVDTKGTKGIGVAPLLPGVCAEAAKPKIKVNGDLYFHQTESYADAYETQTAQ